LWAVRRGWGEMLWNFSVCYVRFDDGVARK